MVESVMLVVAGFLAACLLALALAPAQWRRAVRLTEMRIRARTPLSMAEIQADKDRVRAEFAIALRRLEKTIDRLRDQNVALRTQLARAADATASDETGNRVRAIAAADLDEQNDELRKQLAKAQKEAEAHLKALNDANEALKAKNAELDKARAAARDASIRVDEQKVQIAALTTRLASDEQRLRHFDRSAKPSAAAQAAPPPPAAMAASADLAELAARLEQAESELSLARAETSARILEIEELRAQLADRERAARDMGRRLDTFEKLVSAGDGGDTGKLAPLEAARDAALSARDAAEAERARLAAEVEVLRRELADARERDRGETDLLRDRLAEIAAKVAYMSTAIEGGDPVVEKILREGRNGSGAAGEPARAASLADRIRALRTRAPN